MNNARIILFRQRDKQHSDNTPWFCAYAKFSIIENSRNFTYNPNILSSENKTNSIVIRSAGIENITVDFLENYILPLDRKCFIDQKKNQLTCLLKVITISKISSTTNRLLICIKKETSILLGEKLPLNDFWFVLCQEIDFSTKYISYPALPHENIEFIFTLKNYSILNKTAFLNANVFESKDNDLIIKKTGNNINIFPIHKIEPYNEPAPQWNQPHNPHLLDFINDFKIDEDNTLELIYNPIKHEYMGSSGSRNIHVYEKIVKIWRRQFQNLLEAHEYLLSLDLSSKFTNTASVSIKSKGMNTFNTVQLGPGWESVRVVGGQIDHRIDSYEVDNR